MVAGIDLAQIAVLVGDPARANMLSALMDGRALTASELAYIGRVSPPTTSGHLARLLDARLVAVAKQGRHRYYRLASPLVAQMLESITAVAGLEAPKRYRPRSAQDAALRFARLCYDHLAGRVGVALADALIAQGRVVLDADGGEVTPSGRAFLAGTGIDLAAAAQQRRAFCRPCLDWSERRPHLAGAIGAALAAHCLAQRWVERIRDTRTVKLTARGRDALRNLFGVDAAGLEESAR